MQWARNLEPTKCSACKSTILVPASIEMLGEASAGVPRTLNFLARHAWSLAAARQSSAILPEHVALALRAVPAAQERLPT